MKADIRPSTIIYQFLYTLKSVPESIHFLRKNRLWRGLSSYGWVIKILMAAAVLIGLKFFFTITSWWSSLRGEEEEAIGLLSSVGGLAQNMALEGYELFTAGFMKYVILILLEVIVFHIMRGTLAIVAGRESGTDFNEFLHAQIRMIKVVIRCWVLEFIITLLLSIAFGILGMFDWLETPLTFGIQCYFLGMVIIDNYAEQFDVKIKDSFEFAKGYIGISLALGLVLYMLMLLPLIGSLLGPVVVSVTGALVLYELTDLHLRTDLHVQEDDDLL